MKSFINLYKNAFGGLSPAAWMLALVIFINRSGTMVIPFLSVYLTSSMGFTLVEAGWVMSSFGMGSIIGSYLGGWFTDRVGHFKVQFFSLIGGGLMFFALSQMHTFQSITIFVFCVSIVTEMLRPANQTSVASYAKPENVTRAFSLNRMAINLGFSVGPAIGGFLAAVSYDWLFIADGVTCISAGMVFFFYFRNKKANEPQPAPDAAPDRKVWSDRLFLGFIALVMGFAMLFFQLFTTWPIYQREAYLLPEQEIGYLLGLNGLIVFLFEMVLVYKIGERIPLRKLIGFGTLLMSLSFFSLMIFEGKFVLYLACILISFAEIFAMPFMATYTIQRSGTRNKGAYMGLYAMGFASAFVLAPLVGTNVIASWDFQTWWMVAAVLAILLSVGFYSILKIKKSAQPA